jgi:hypothetical protein
MRGVKICRMEIQTYKYAGPSIDVSGRSINREVTHVNLSTAIFHQHWHGKGVIGAFVMLKTVIDDVDSIYVMYSIASYRAGTGREHQRPHCLHAKDVTPVFGLVYFENDRCTPWAGQAHCRQNVRTAPGSEWISIFHG